MMKSRRPAIAGALSIAFGLAILAGCRNQPSDPELTPSPTPSPTEPPGLLVGIDLHAGAGSDAWLVSGVLRHDGPAPLAHPRLDLRFLDSSGALLGSVSFDLELFELPPDTTWPVLEAVTLPAPPRSVEGRLHGEEGASAPIGRLVAEPLSQFVDADGSTVLLGSLVNPGPQAVEIDGLRVAGATPTGEWIALIDGLPALNNIGPGEPIPFLARLPGRVQRPDLDGLFRRSSPAGPAPVCGGGWDPDTRRRPGQPLPHRLDPEQRARTCGCPYHGAAHIIGSVDFSGDPSASPPPSAGRTGSLLPAGSFGASGRMAPLPRRDKGRVRDGAYRSRGRGFRAGGQQPAPASAHQRRRIQRLQSDGLRDPDRRSGPLGERRVGPMGGNPGTGRIRSRPRVFAPACRFRPDPGRV